MAWSKSTARIQPSPRTGDVTGSSNAVVSGSAMPPSGTPVPHGPERLVVARPGGRSGGGVEPVETLDESAELGVLEGPGIDAGMGGPEGVDEALEVAPVDRRRAHGASIRGNVGCRGSRAARGPTA